MKGPTVLVILFILSFHAHCAYNEWKDRVIYHLLTDRFKNGNSTNDQPPNYSLNCWGGSDISFDTKKFVGGDFVGITSQLGYIELLIGPGSIWISPLDQQITTVSSLTTGTCAYHGYWPDFPNPSGNYNTCSIRIDTHWGTDEDLVGLLNELQTKNMLFIQDLVPNHCGYGGEWPSSSPGDFFSDNCKDALCNDCLGCHLGGLPVIKIGNNPLNNPWKYIVACQLAWFTSPKFSPFRKVWGVRIDAVRHMSQEFFTSSHGIIGQLNTINPNMFTFGEHSYPDNSLYSQIIQSNSQSGLTSMLNWAVFNDIGALYQQNGSAATIFSTITSNYHYWSQSPYSIDTALTFVNFIDNHDHDRFFSKLLARYGSASYPLLANAYMVFGILMTIPGIPVIYYGTEIGLLGSGEDNNRRNIMPDGSFGSGTISWVFNYNFKGFTVNSEWYLPTSQEMALEIYSNLTKAIKIRNSTVNLRRGYYYELWKHCQSAACQTCSSKSAPCEGCPFGQTSNVASYLRSLSDGEDTPTIIVLNNGDEESGPLMIPIYDHSSNCGLASQIHLNDISMLPDGTVLYDSYQQSKQPGLNLTTISGGYLRPRMKNGKSLSIFKVRKAQAGYCSVTFTLISCCNLATIGQAVYITGSIGELNYWGTWNSVRMNYLNNKSWRITVNYIKDGTKIEFKTQLQPYEPAVNTTPCDSEWYVIWEKGSNHTGIVDCKDPNITFCHQGWGLPIATQDCK